MNNMMMDFVKKYESPKVEVIEVEVEQGFATSDGDFGGTGGDFPWGD